MAAELILIATPSHEEGDRIALAMAPLGSYAFVFAQAVDTALQVAAGLQPDLTIAALAGVDGVTLCERLRLVPETRPGRVLLIIPREHLNEARTAGANSVLLQPVSSLFAGLEAKRTLERLERRTPWVTDRRAVFRGGRRITDLGVG